MTNPKPDPCAEGTIQSVKPAQNCIAGAKPWILAATVLGSSLAFIDGSVVNVALPAIEADLAISADAVQWLVNAYILCRATLILIGGAAGDLFGRRLVFVVGIVIFAIASIGCGLAADVTQLILARALQGIGAALLVPCSLAIIGATFDETERGKAIGTWAACSAIAAAAGPIVGGLIVDHASWRLIFLINPLLAVPALLITLRHVPESRDEAASGDLDWPGALLAFVGLGSVTFGLIASSDRGLADAAVATSLSAGLVLLVIFIVVERQRRTPMLPLDLFHSRVFTGINLLTFLLYAALGGALFFLPFDLIEVRGYSTTSAGAVFLPFTLMMGLLSRWSGGLLGRFGARLPLTIGPAIAALGFALLAWPAPIGSEWGIILTAVATLGLGMAISVAPLTATIFEAVPAHRSGVASGVNNAVASVAGLLAVAIFGTIALNHLERRLDQQLATQQWSVAAQQTLVAARHTFVVPDPPATLSEPDRQRVQAVIRDALADSIRQIMLLAAVLALLGSICSALTIPPGIRRKPGST